MGKFIHKILYRTLPLEGYLRAVSRLFFLWQRMGIGREAPATEYVYHLPKLVRAGDTCIDIGANLGYYARTISRLAGPAGKVYAVEPVAPIRKVLSRNLRRCTLSARPGSSNATIAARPIRSRRSRHSIRRRINRPHRPLQRQSRRRQHNPTRANGPSRRARTGQSRA